MIAIFFSDQAKPVHYPSIGSNWQFLAQRSNWMENPKLFKEGAVRLCHLLR